MRYADLFCGAGGVACGLARAGWDCVGAFDCDAHALSVYGLNFPGHPTHQVDLADPLPEPLVASLRRELAEGAVWASSPCTDFSTANAAPRDRSSLTATLARHVLDISPAWFLFENVPRARKSAEFAELVRSLEAGGYAVEHRVVSALGAGVPQTRRRLFLIAARGAERAARVALERFEELCSGEAATMRQRFDAAGVACPTPYIYIPSCDERRRKSIFTLDGPSPTVRGLVRPFRATYPFPPRDDTHDRALVFASGLEHIAALQCFPTDFRWCGGKTAMAKCIGNAVPPPMAERLARAVSDHAPRPSSRAAASHESRWPSRASRCDASGSTASDSATPCITLARESRTPRRTRRTT